MHRDLRLGRAHLVDRVVAQVEGGRLGQPLLFTGPAGSGKDVSALAVARRLNCRLPATCDHDRPCESCRKALSFQHPDIRWLGPAPAAFEDPAQVGLVRALLEAKVADPFHVPDVATTGQVLIGNPEHPGPLTVRGLMQFTRRQRFQGNWKVAVVADAHRMNTAAANALLKTLEEPPPATLIILHTSRPSSLLPTILSRCQKLNFLPYAEDELARVLAELRPQVAAAEQQRAVRLAGGDARRALALLEPEMETLFGWATTVYLELQEGRTFAAHAAAELLNQGLLRQLDDQGKQQGKAGKVDDSPSRRRRALVFCEVLGVLCGELLACRERGEGWCPRLPDQEASIRRVAGRRRPAGLMADLERIERAKHEIDGNLNLGLVMAALGEDLGSHVRRDQTETQA